MESETKFYNDIYLHGLEDSIFMMSFILNGTVEHGFRGLTVNEYHYRILFQIPLCNSSWC
jgi:hypothetical protein